jgi:hypothetical protein
MVGKERLFRRPVPDGAYVTAMGIIKRVWLDETTGVGDASFWEELRNRRLDKKYTNKQACFQYYLVGYTHIEMAETLLDTIPRFRSMRLTGDLAGGPGSYISKAANALFEYFPPKYRKKLSNEIPQF